MTVVVGADHAGYDLKEMIKQWLIDQKVEVLDVGALTYDAGDDYPDFGQAVAEAVVEERGERGIVFCGSGVGAGIAANKVRGALAAVCHDTYSAHQGVEHDGMNVLVLGGRIIGIELAKEIVTAYLGAEVSTEERHVRRREKVTAIEKKYGAA
ncbi:MAG: ribose 5-phosphate isomerase B [Anaerolineae bacterium]|nr:ribose 5-phosphate isomerase B [Anaerolineae bacterium]